MPSLMTKMLPNLSFLGDFLQNTSDITLIIILFSIFIILTTLFYKLGVFEDDYQKPRSTPGENIPTQMMKKVHNPFFLQLKEDATASMKDAVTLKLTNQFPCCLRAYWGLGIQDIYPMLYQPWDSFLQILQDDFIKDHSLGVEEVWQIEKQNETEVCLGAPEGVNLPAELGPAPRSRYPLVVVVVDSKQLQLSAKERKRTNDPDQIVCMVTMIHLPDEACPGEAHVLAQFVRTVNCQPYDLRKLYMTANSAQEDAALTDTGSECIVCVSAPVQRALLPCRHACVCDDCFVRLSSCPVCRTFIDSYFKIAESSVTDDEVVEESEVSAQ